MELIELFKILAEIDSVSGEEEKIGKFIQKFLENLGLKTQIDSSGNIYCRTGSSQNPRLFCAHMDTVEPGRGIRVIEKDGLLVSQGETILGGDNKVALAAILYNLQNIDVAKTDIECLFTVREETDSGIQEINKNLIKSKVGYIFDGGHGDLGWLVVKASTIQDFQIEIFGKISHASQPEIGINTIEILNSFLSKFKLGRVDPDTTFNIGLINGGSATNSIPGYLKMQGDLRSTSSDIFEEHKRTIISIFQELEKTYNCKIKVEFIPYAYGYSLDNSSQYLNHLKKVYALHDIKLNPIQTTSGSDAGFLNYIGVTTFCLGDGVQDTHTVEERIEVEKFRKLSDIVYSLMINQ